MAEDSVPGPQTYNVIRHCDPARRRHSARVTLPDRRLEAIRISAARPRAVRTNSGVQSTDRRRTTSRWPAHQHRLGRAASPRRARRGVAARPIRRPCRGGAVEQALATRRGTDPDKPTRQMSRRGWHGNPLESREATPRTGRPSRDRRVSEGTRHESGEVDASWCRAGQRRTDRASGRQRTARPPSASASSFASPAPSGPDHPSRPRAAQVGHVDEQPGPDLAQHERALQRDPVVQRRGLHQPLQRRSGRSPAGRTSRRTGTSAGSPG